MDDILIKFKDSVLHFKIYIKSGSLYIFSSLFTAVIGIVINPFMAKNLSPDDYAIMGYFSSFSLIISPLLNFSLISYYLRNYYILAENRRQIVSDTILIFLSVYGFVALIFVSFVFYFYWKWSNVSFPFFPFAILTFAPLYINNFLALYQVNCRLKREAGKYSKITIINALLNTLLAVFLVIIYKYGATGRLLATFLASILIAVFCFYKLFEKFQFDWNVIKDSIKFGWPLSLSAILWYFLSGVDRAMLEKLNDSYTLGFYNVGLGIAGYLTIFYTALAQTFEPDIYKAIAENKKRKLIKIIGGIISINALPNILFIIFAPFIVSLLTYNRYAEASSFARIFALQNISITFYYTAITIIVGYGYTKSELVIRSIGALLIVLMYRLLIEKFGFMGAAWGQVLSFILMSIIAFTYIIIKLKLRKYKQY